MLQTGASKCCMHPSKLVVRRKRGLSCRATASLARLEHPVRILDGNNYKNRLSELWAGRGATYDSSDTFHVALAEALVELACPQQGQVVLDIASGTGMAALPAARRVGVAGRVVGVDISGSMLDQARAKASQARLKNATFFKGDIETQDFETGSFDIIMCSSGMIYLQDLEHLCNLDKVTKVFNDWLTASGKLSFNTPKEPCVPATAVFYQLLRENFNLNLADAAAPIATAEKVELWLKSSGFAYVQVTSSQESIMYKDVTPEGYASKIWDTMTSPNSVMTPLIGILTQDQLQYIKPRYMKLVQEMADAWMTLDGIRNPYTMLWCVGKKGVSK